MASFGQAQDLGTIGAGGQHCGDTNRHYSKLKILDYYLTFIHYFGFSINPLDDLGSRYLSIRVKQVASAAAAASLKQQQQQHQQQQQLTAAWPSDLANRLMHSVYGDAVLRGGESDAADGDLGPNQNEKRIQFNNNIIGKSDRSSIAHSWQQQQPQLKQGRCLLKALVKLIAISLTSFLALNHVIVLVLYIYQGSKVFMELLLELRLVITKFSALIFVISWHRNQTKVRQLVKLVKSTSVYILTNGQQEPESCSTAISHELGLDNDLQQPGLAGPIGQQEQLDKQESGCKLEKLNWKVLNWWLMCTCVTIIHFSLSEVEIRTAQHLWQWLEEYSLYQLNNQTTSISSLFIMASFDNYIYTVHVYGTRLIGASIICIVCSFQIENIHYLNEQTLAALRSAAAIPTKTTTTTTTCKAGSASDSERSELLFVLAESDWLQVERARSVARPIGWLSATLAHKWSRLQLLRRLPRRLSNNLATSYTVLVTFFGRLLCTRDRGRSHPRAWPLSAQTGATSAQSRPPDSVHSDCVSWRSNRVTPTGHRAHSADCSGSTDCDEATTVASTNRPAIDGMKQRQFGRGQSRAESGRRETTNGFEPSDRAGCGNVARPSGPVQIAQRASAAATEGEHKGEDADGAAAVGDKSGPTPMDSGGDLSNQAMTVSSSSGSGAMLVLGRIRFNNSNATPAVTTTTTTIAAQSLAADQRMAAAMTPFRKRPYLSMSAATMAPPIGRFASNCYLSRAHSYLLNSGTLTATGPSWDAGQQKTDTDAMWPLGAASLVSNLSAGRCLTEKACHRYLTGTTKGLLPPAPAPNSNSSNNKNNDRDQGGDQLQAAQHNHLLGQRLELYLDKLAKKYELVRTVNMRVDNCFGHMLLSQYSFLFLMSCIDVVYFSLSFNPKTKTKYIIVSGMILLWWPYLLLYKFASDIGLASKQLLTSVRRLARLAVVLQLSSPAAVTAPSCARQAPTWTQSPMNPLFILNNYPNDDSDNIVSDCDGTRLLDRLHVPVQLQDQPLTQQPRRFRLGSIAVQLSPELANGAIGNGPGDQRATTTRRARILDKLEHVFKPSHLSIVGIMTMDKFFLLNFAKIVITASVMTIQFISKG